MWTQKDMITALPNPQAIIEIFRLKSFVSHKGDNSLNLVPVVVAASPEICSGYFPGWFHIGQSQVQCHPQICSHPHVSLQLQQVWASVTITLYHHLSYADLMHKWRIIKLLAASWRHITTTVVVQPRSQVYPYQAAAEGTHWSGAYGHQHHETSIGSNLKKVIFNSSFMNMSEVF